MFRSSAPPRSSAFFSAHSESGYTRVVRSARRFEDEDDIRIERLNIGGLLDALGRGGPLLVDSRLAPVHTDFELGVEFKALRQEINRGFERIAVLVQTKLGVLQANRIRQQDQYDVIRVFDDENEALAFLMTK